MSTEITLIGSLVGLLPVLVGGLIATSGAFIGAHLTNQLNQRSADKKLKREKLEQIVKSAQGAAHWLDELKNSTLFNSSTPEGISPLTDVECLAKLYFPELNKVVIGLSLAYSDLNCFIIETKKYQLANNGAFPKDFLGKYKSIYPKLSSELNELIEECGNISVLLQAP
jgi:hypothetical protein